MNLSELMTKDVKTIHPATICVHAAELMATLDIGAIPIVDEENGKPIGVVTDRDLALRVVGRNLDPKKTHVKDIMSKKVFTISHDQTVDDAEKLMKREQVRRIVVTDDNDRVIGIVSLGDLAIAESDPSSTGQVLKEVSVPAGA